MFRFISQAVINLIQIETDDTFFVSLEFDLFEFSSSLLLVYNRKSLAFNA